MIMMVPPGSIASPTSVTICQIEPDTSFRLEIRHSSFP